ncbi:MAG: ComEC/Rec2 family competence protein [Myxococcales bacterium]|nr:ComEC/Rec2 family competence protein [Myxococcales bacterium]
MAALSLALALIAALAVGVHLPGAPLWAALLSAGGVIAAGIAWARVFAHGRRTQAGVAALIIVLLGAGLVRGWAASHSPPSVVIPRGLIAGEVLGASVPGPRCRIDVDVGGERWRLEADPSACPRAAGERIWLRAEEVSRAEAAHLPWGRGSEDPRSGSVRRVYVDRIWRAPGLQGGVGERYFAWVAALRQRAWEASRGRPAESLVVGASLGMSSALAPELRAEVRGAGLGHLLAVSGLHVALAGMLVIGGISRVLAAVGWTRPEISLLGLGPVIAYVLLTGGAPSAVRAAVMLALVVLAATIGRPGHGPTILAVTAAALLIVWPQWAVDPGLQMSLAAMAALVHPRAPRGLVAQSWRVTWATLPVAIWHFGGGSLLGVVANLVALPIFCAWVLPLGILGIFGLGILGPAALGPAGIGAAIILDVSALLRRVPATPPELLAGIAAALLVGVLVVERRGRGPKRGASWRMIPGWRPPLVALAAVIVAVPLRSPSGGDGALTEDRWWVVGGGRRLEVVAPAVDGAGVAGICIDGPWLSPAARSGQLEHLGRPRAVVVRDPRGGPAEAEHRRLLESLGVWGPVGDGEAIRCAWPELSRRALSRLLRRCQRELGAHTALLRGDGDGAIECWRRDGWRRLVTDDVVDDDAAATAKKIGEEGAT